MNNIIDTSHELILTRHHDGIKLMRPDTVERARQPITSSIITTMKDVMSFPFNFYIHNRICIIQDLNEAGWSGIGYKSKNEAIHAPVTETCLDDELASRVRDNNKKVIQSQHSLIVEEKALLLSKVEYCVISIKVPCYDYKNRLVGIVGCSVEINPLAINKVAGNLAAVTNLMLGKQCGTMARMPGKIYNNFYFTSREMDVIHWMIRGKTLREISMVLNISHRTVESYFNNIKTKADVRTKSELIDMVLSELI